MKFKIEAIFVLVIAASTTAISSASAQEVTRAQVRADLIRVEQAGYNPTSGDDSTYPADIQAADANVATQASIGHNGVGGVALNGSSAAGTRVGNSAQSFCVGPVSFCNIYSGG